MKWQEEKEAAEITAKTPRLKVADISVPTENIPTEIREIHGCRVLLHREKTRGLVHQKLYFSLAGCTIEEMQMLSVATNVFARLSTKAHTGLEAEKLQKKYIGDLDFNVIVFSDREDKTKCKPCFEVSFSVLEQYEKKGARLVKEILTDTDFTSSENQMMTEFLMTQGKEDLYLNIVTEGSHYAALRAERELIASAKLTEAVEGYSFYQFLTRLLTTKNWTAVFGQIMEALAKRIFVKENLIVSISCDRPEEHAGLLTHIFEGSKTKGDWKTELPLCPLQDTELIEIPGQVGFAATACMNPDGSLAYSGTMDVLSNALDFDYLWKNIRIKGGAYGCNNFFSTNGLICFSSYRDPAPENSIGIFEKTMEFIRSFAEEDGALDAYIIGAVSNTEPLMHPRQRMAKADTDYFTGVRPGDRERWKAEMLSATREKIAELACVFDRSKAVYSSCIFGSVNE